MSTDKINWPAEWKDCTGEKTIAIRSEQKLPVKLYTSWFCPFAQRAWIAMEEKKVDYQWVEINPYEIDPREPGGYTKKALPLSEKEKRHPGFLAVSPAGLVPGLDNNGEKVHDSLNVVQYIDEAFKGPPLLPSSPLERARQRCWSNFVTEKIQKNYYTMLIAQDEEIQESFRKKFFETCREFASEMADPSKGPYFLGDEFTMVDIAFAPFWQRFLWVGGAYRNLKFPKDDAAFKRLDIWWNAVSNRPSVKATLVCKPRLLSSYKQYARNEATSSYGKMIQAHIKKQVKKGSAHKRSAGFGIGIVAATCAASSLATFIATKTFLNKGKK
mmetsp:Transcript_34989/g.56690  ORF Transcript_34989/g.56690 Transcript_34989/m.56690 type:complete len:328 (-) Transcript_34989:193-1176(-)